MVCWRVLQKHLVDVCFLSLNFFVIVPFHFSGPNYLGFVGLGSTLYVSGIAADKQYRFPPPRPVFEHQAIFYHDEFEVPVFEIWLFSQGRHGGKDK